MVIGLVQSQLSLKHAEKEPDELKQSLKEIKENEHHTQRRRHQNGFDQSSLKDDL